MSRVVIGVDNGTTGTIAVLNGKNGDQFIKTPIVKQQNYTKKKGNVSRIAVLALTKFLKEQYVDSSNVIVLIERPLVNPTRFAATLSAVRALEATLTILEALELPYVYIDSKEWQKELLPKGCTGSTELKKASLDIGVRLFPQFKELILKHKDADGLLIAEFGRRKYT